MAGRPRKKISDATKLASTLRELAATLRVRSERSGSDGSSSGKHAGCADGCGAGARSTSGASSVSTGDIPSPAIGPEGIEG